MAYNGHVRTCIGKLRYGPREQFDDRHQYIVETKEDVIYCLTVVAVAGRAERPVQHSSVYIGPEIEPTHINKRDAGRLIIEAYYY